MFCFRLLCRGKFKLYKEDMYGVLVLVEFFIKVSSKISCVGSYFGCLIYVFFRILVDTIFERC